MNPKPTWSGVRPFSQQGHYTEIHNFVMDVAMPKLSGSAFKILMLIIRRTKGWQKKSEALSYNEIMDGTGIGSEATVRKALVELLSDELFGCPLILSKSAEKKGAVSQKATRYALNRQFEFNRNRPQNIGAPDSPKPIDEGPQSEAPASSENEDAGAPEKGDLSGDNGASKSEDEPLQELKGTSSENEDVGTSENEAPIKNKGESNYEEVDTSARSRESENPPSLFPDLIEGSSTTSTQFNWHSPFVQGANDPRFKTPHFAAMCQACGRDPQVVTWKLRCRMAAAALVIQEAGFTPADILRARQLIVVDGPIWPEKIQDDIGPLLRGANQPHPNQNGVTPHGIYPTTHTGSFERETRSQQRGRQITEELHDLVRQRQELEARRANLSGDTP